MDYYQTNKCTATTVISKMHLTSSEPSLVELSCHSHLVANFNNFNKSQNNQFTIGLIEFSPLLRFYQVVYNKDAAMFVGSKLPISLPKAVQTAKEYACNQTAIYRASRQCKAFANPESCVRTMNSDNIQSVVKKEIASFRQAFADLKTMHTKALTQERETRFSTIQAGSGGSKYSVSTDASSQRPDDLEQQSSRYTRSSLNTPSSK